MGEGGTADTEGMTGSEDGTVEEETNIMIAEEDRVDEGLILAKFADNVCSPTGEGAVVEEEIENSKSIEGEIVSELPIVPTPERNVGEQALLPVTEEATEQLQEQIEHLNVEVTA